MKNKYPFPLMVIHWLTFVLVVLAYFTGGDPTVHLKSGELHIFAGVSVFLLFFIRIIMISIYKKDNNLIITMSNNGPLIEVDLRGKIFIPFFTTKELSQGVGLGLNVSQSLLESIGGQLWLEKDVVMTQFSISLPVQK